MCAPLPAAAAIESPARALPAALVALLAVCCAASVANVYYAQPLLDAIAADFHIPHAEVGAVITATQIGAGLALLFVVPLGDRLDRRRLIAWQAAMLAVACIGVAAARSTPALLAGMLAAGLLGTAMTQGLIACAAALAGEHERGRVVGAAQGGVVVGLLSARSLAGVVTDLAGWRAVYLVSALLALLMLGVLLRCLPAMRAPPGAPGYMSLLRSMAGLLRHERVLRQRGLIGMAMFAALGTFWSALVLPLSAPPHALSHTAIGAFGLVGAFGALAAARAGRLVDRGKDRITTGLALAMLCAAWLPIACLDRSLALLVVGIVLLDVGGQAIHVVNQSLILRARPDAQARLVGCYMLFYSAGSGLGAILSTLAHARAGWAGVCGLGAGFSVLALVCWGASLRDAREQA